MDQHVPDAGPSRRKFGRTLEFARRCWPWLLAAALALLAVHLLDNTQKEDADAEFPDVERIYFSRYVPAVYRLAEPGDSLDRAGLYLAAAGLGIAVPAWWRSRRPTWLAAIGLLALLGWVSAAPWPTFDAWPGWNPRELLEPHTPTGQRLAIGAISVVLLALILGPLVRARSELLAILRRTPLLSLTVAACVASRLLEWPALEPVGYWPRWALLIGLTLLDAEMLRHRQPAARPSLGRRVLVQSATIGAVAVLIVLGVRLMEWHRPLGRLKVIEPGKLYISAMPTYRGLEEVERRHGIRTIINLFSETGPQRHPGVVDERRFAREHGVAYIEHPPDLNPGDSGDLEFLELALELARDPKAGPVLVHCHGCMDRTPAWTGIYRFLYQGWPLDRVLTEIERHRGTRPKGSVYHLYNWALPQLAPDRFAVDPTAARLRAATVRSPAPYRPRVEARRVSSQRR